MTLEVLPLDCPRCSAALERGLEWIQEHTRILCEHCGGSFLIDKDKLALWLARRESGVEVASADAPDRQPHEH